MPESPEKLDLASLDVAADKRRLLQRLFPEAVTETTDAHGRDQLAVDFDKLKAVLGEHARLATPGQERYGLEWPGKRDALKAVQAPSLATLIPAPDESVDWDTTSNVFIEGDNLEVLKLLQKSYYGQVKMIYIDPPYNTGNDFVYPDNYAESLDTYLRYTGQIDDQGFRTTTNSKDSGRFHSNWLRMMYPRLYVAKNLLKEDGFLLISCDDAEYSNLLLILYEMIGEENYVGTIVWDRNRKNDAKLLSVGHEYMILFAKNKNYLTENGVVLRFEKPGIEEAKRRLVRLRAKHNNNWEEIRKEWSSFYRSLSDSDPRKPISRFSKIDEKGPFRDDGDISWPGGGGPRYDVLHPVTKLPCKVPSRGWVYGSPARMQEEIDVGKVVFGIDAQTVPTLRTNLFEQTDQVLGSVHFSYAQKASQDFDRLFDGKRVFDNPKNFQDLQLLIDYLSTTGELVVDFFAGSASTAHAAFALSVKRGDKRPWICVQLPEPLPDKGHASLNAAALGAVTIADIAKERMRRAGAKIREEWETQNASREDAKARSEEEKAGDLFSESNPQSTIHNLLPPPDLGFRVFKLAPSNFKRWDGEAAAASKDALVQQMEANLDHIATSATEESLLFEILLKAGYQLTCPLEKLTLAGHAVWSVDGGSLCVCVEDRIDAALVDAVADKHPVQFICLDRALQGNDPLKVNTLETFRAAQPEIQFRTV